MMNLNWPLMAPPAEMSLEQRVEMTASARDCDAVPKVAGAGAVFVDPNGERLQRMHNGLKVVADGYCGAWMTRLIERCRGHHEPQEEFAFHNVVGALSERATMIEIGGYWSYYSMWFLQNRPDRRAIIVEPDTTNLALAEKNLALNNLKAELVRGYIGQTYAHLISGAASPPPAIDVPDLLAAKGLTFIDLLHCDAQGAETELLESCEALFRAGRVGWLFLSTHGAAITGDPLTHQKCLARLQDLGAVIEAEHDLHESFSGDGLIVARFGSAPLNWTFPKLSRNRYSTSYYRNPLYDIAAGPERPPGVWAPTEATRCVGVWIELQRDSALGRKGDRILSPSDTVLLPYLLENGQWHTEPLDLALKLLDRDADYTVVDIGANVGLFSRQFILAFKGVRRCLCVEPDRRNFEAMEANLRSFAGLELKLFPFALAGVSGQATLFRDHDNIGNFSLNRDAMRDRKFDQAEIPVVDAADWANQHLGGDERIILKTDTQGMDETIVTRIPLDIWRKVAFACIEIWRIEKPAFDENLFRAIVESFPHRSFRGVENGPVEVILEYASGTDWQFYDLYLWR